jgi:hypothetical protein
MLRCQPPMDSSGPQPTRMTGQNRPRRAGADEMRFGRSTASAAVQ